MDPVDLVERARAAHEHAYVPYSEYPVGAAVETASGDVFEGCNHETANYSNTLHAEEVALAAALTRGHREFVQIAVSSAARDGVTPCGMCRQTLVEFCDPSFPVHCDVDGTIETLTLGELLPDPITAETLDR